MNHTATFFSIRTLTLGRFFLGVIVLSFFAYCALLVQTVQAVGERKDLSTDIRDMKTELAQLEISYYAQVHSLGLSTFDTSGYVTTQPHFVMADGSQVTSAVAMR